MAPRPTRKVTYSLPDELLEQVRAVVSEGAAPSYSAFVERALTEEVRRAREKKLAEAFREAAEDPAFLADVDETMRDFRASDAELAGEGE